MNVRRRHSKHSIPPTSSKGQRRRTWTDRVFQTQRRQCHSTTTAEREKLLVADRLEAVVHLEMHAKMLDTRPARESRGEKGHSIIDESALPKKTPESIGKTLDRGRRLAAINLRPIPKRLCAESSGKDARLGRVPFPPSRPSSMAFQRRSRHANTSVCLRSFPSLGRRVFITRRRRPQRKHQRRTRQSTGELQKKITKETLIALGCRWSRALKLFRRRVHQNAQVERAESREISAKVGRIIRPDAMPRRGQSAPSFASNRFRFLGQIETSKVSPAACPDKQTRNDAGGKNHRRNNHWPRSDNQVCRRCSCRQ